MKKGHRVAAEVKADIIRRIKEVGVLSHTKAKQRSLANHWRDDAEAQRGPKKELMQEQKPQSKTELAKSLGVSRQSLYYTPKKEARDWQTKVKLEEVLREHPSYGSRRLALHLRLNRKGVKRVMQRFGIKPCRRHGRKYLVKKRVAVIYPNLLMTMIPAYTQHSRCRLQYSKKRIITH